MEKETPPIGEYLDNIQYESKKSLSYPSTSTVKTVSHNDDSTGNENSKSASDMHTSSSSESSRISSEPLPSFDREKMVSHQKNDTSTYGADHGTHKQKTKNKGVKRPTAGKKRSASKKSTQLSASHAGSSIKGKTTEYAALVGNTVSTKLQVFVQKARDWIRSVKGLPKKHSPYTEKQMKILERLARFRQGNIVTEQEFIEQKQKILSRV